MTDQLLSKVLVLDNSPEHADTIKHFCDENNLAGLKVQKNNLMSVLRSNIDLGAILYSENYGDTPEENAEMSDVSDKNIRGLKAIAVRAIEENEELIAEACRILG